MRRTLTIVLVLIAAVALLLWLLLGGNADRGLPDVEPVPPAATAITDSIVEIQPPAEVETTVRAAAVMDSAERTIAVEASPASAAQCIVFGRVVDELSAPIIGATLRLYASKKWAEGIDVPRLPGRKDMRGFEVESGASGAFRFEVPVPTVPATSFEIRPDRFHEMLYQAFSEPSRDGKPPLVAGERDLGDISLVSTGALRGRVLDTAGNPIADAEMSFGDKLTSIRDVRTTADGTYVIAHAKAGTYDVSAKADGYLVFTESLVTVETGRDTDVKDIVLGVAPTIEGIVIDENGRPLEGAKLWGYPSSSGFGAGASSGSDGRFVVYLPQDEPYTLTAKLDGHVSWGEERTIPKFFEPGLRNLEIVLATLPHTKFTVVDDETGRPIERFALQIRSGFGPRYPASVVDHPQGVAEATARVGVDEFFVNADGYAWSTGNVKHDVEGVPAQTVRMRRGCGVRGRVLRDGIGVPDAPVEIAKLLRKRAPKPGESFPDVIDANTRRSTRTDSEGRFTLIGLDKGEQRLTVRPTVGVPLVLEHVEVAGTEPIDVGDLVLVAGGTILGTMLLPEGVVLPGNTVHLDSLTDDRKAAVEPNGAFRFDDVPAGNHFLLAEERPGLLARGDFVPVEVVSGATVSVTLDARDLGLSTVTLDIELDGLAAKGLQVDLEQAAGKQDRVALGACGEAGHVRGTIRALGAARAVVWLPDGRRLRHPRLLEVAPRVDTQASLHFELARVDVRLPASLSLPRDGELRLHLAAPGESVAPTWVTVRFADGSIVGDARLYTEHKRGVTVAALSPGAYALTVDLVDDSAAWVEIPAEGGKQRREQQPYHRVTRGVVLAAGETLAFEL